MTSWFGFMKHTHETESSSSDDEDDETSSNHKGEKGWLSQIDKSTENEESDVENDPMSLLFVNPRIVNKRSKTYELESRAFVTTVTQWHGQRAVNDTHVRSLIKGITDLQELMGEIAVAIDKNKNVRLLDGQHRWLALKTIMRENPLFNIPITVRAYDVDDIESSIVGDLFLKLNNTQNMSKTDLPDNTILLVVKRLAQLYPTMIIDKKANTHRVNRPRICKLLLTQKLKEFHVKYPVSEDVLFDSIIQLNKEYGVKPQHHFGKNLSPKCYKTATSVGFFLGLDSSYGWVMSLKI